MKINGDRTSAGFPVEKNDRPSRTPSKSGMTESARPIETGDEVELTGRPATILNALRETNIDASKSPADELDSIRQKLEALNSRIKTNPLEALSAQANLKSESVARLVV